MRTGYTTGTCAAASSKAAVMALCGHALSDAVDIELPDGSLISIPLQYIEVRDDYAEAAVIKDGGDDPDITHNVTVKARVARRNDSEIRFIAGEGVGTVTKPGLQITPGEPAINPVPREMIRKAIGVVSASGFNVTISIPGGSELAEKTFNPRLGIKGGLSIIGSSGVVRPFSQPALVEALKCSLNIADASGVKNLIYVPGHIGAKAAARNFKYSEEQLIEVSNAWGAMLEALEERGFESLLAVGHPGKMAKLAAGNWDTHSSRAESALGVINKRAREVFGRVLPDAVTAEGLFSELELSQRSELGAVLAEDVRVAITNKTNWASERVAVTLINMQGEILGEAGELKLWR